MPQRGTKAHNLFLCLMCFFVAVNFVRRGAGVVELAALEML